MRAVGRYGGSAVGRYGGTAVRQALVVLALVTGLPPCRLAAQSLTTVTFTVASAAAVDSVRRLGIDVVEIHPRAGGATDLVAVVTPRDRDQLGSRGWTARDLPRAPAAAALEARRVLMGARAFTVYRDFDDPARGVAAWLRGMAASHPGAVTLDSIGASVQGRPILAAKIGPPNDDPDRPNVIFLATYHAREWAATEMAMRLLRYLADSLPLLPGGAALLAGRDVWVIPVVNPDGYEYTFTTERLWRKNRRPNADGSFGVDLNRNHAGFWGYDDAGSSALPNSEIYRGPSAASEPEVRAVEAFHRAHPPTASITYHTYTGAVLYPWAHVNGSRSGDDAVFRALAGSDIAPAIPDSLPASINAYYHPGPGWHLYPTNGDYTSYAYRAFRTAAFTVELTSGCCVGGASYGFVFPDDEALLARLTADNIPFALTLLREAVNLNAGAAFPAAAGAVQQFESVWPELQVLLDQPANSGNPPVDIATDSGRIAFALLPRDTMGVGKRFVRKISNDRLLLDARAIRLPLDGLAAEILARDGGELPSTPWHGFTRGPGGYEGQWAWYGFLDTLVSPAITVTGRSNLSLFFWTRHGGSIFQQASRGRVEVSADNGPWTPVAAVVGAAPQWYPVSARLGTAAAGASSIRIRFIAVAMDWGVDAIALTASDALVARLFTPANIARAVTIEISANPVRAAPLVLRWPAATGSARADVFSLTGTRVMTASLGSDPGRWSWDLTNESGQGITNGAYFIVVTRGDGSQLRRRVLVAR